MKPGTFRRLGPVFIGLIEYPQPEPTGGLHKPEDGFSIAAMEQSVYGYVMGQFDSTPLSYQEIADGSGVNKRTVEKIARREIEDPGVSHIEKLERFFRGEGQRQAA